MLRRRHRLTCALALASCAVWAGACGGSPTSAGDFCAALTEHQALLTAPLTSGGDVDAMIDAYRSLERLAPLAIEDEWSQLVTNLETADTVNPADPASLQKAADTAYATEKPAHTVAEWVRSTCGLEIGPVGTVAPLPPTTTTTLVPNTSG